MMADLCIVLVAAILLGLALVWVNIKTGRSPTLKRGSFFGVLATFGLALYILGRMAFLVLR